VTGDEAVAAFAKADFKHVRTQGSHKILSKAGHPLLLSIPCHGNKALKPGLLRGQIRKAGLTVEQFVALLDR
jgi:predicted RNA binding protein YcfA (HicA-like mRNA interferase family)